MSSLSRFAAAALLVISLAGCENMTRHQQRILSGGALGAAGGAVITAVVGGPVLVGAAAGAGVGAVAGAVTH
jgi:hypothetical protein